MLTAAVKFNVEVTKINEESAFKKNFDGESIQITANFDSDGKLQEQPIFTYQSSVAVDPEGDKIEL